MGNFVGNSLMKDKLDKELIIPPLTMHHARHTWLAN